MTKKTKRKRLQIGQHDQAHPADLIVQAATRHAEKIIAAQLDEVEQIINRADNLLELKAMLHTYRANAANSPVVAELFGVIERMNSDAFLAGRFDQAEQDGEAGHA